MGIGNLSIQCGSRTNNALRTNVGFSVGNGEVDRFNSWRWIGSYTIYYLTITNFLFSTRITCDNLRYCIGIVVFDAIHIP